MIKPLDLEWGEIEKDMVVKGKVSRLEKFGVFVDIGAERPGLVHISELTHDYIRTPNEVVNEGEEVEVKVLEVNRQKKQIKLSMKALEEKPEKIAKVIQAKIDKKEKDPAGGQPQQAEVVKEAPIPTAMEMALREAMDRVSTNEPVTTTKKKSKNSNELEDILKRTLKNKVATRQ
jgi:predicted RNA-binding protein with RPS1 domain